MELAVPRTLLTIDEYLQHERAAEERSIYLDGRVFAMAGESHEHGDISTSLTGMLYGQLKGTRCRARVKDTKVRSGPALMSGESTRGFFSYPDILVICGEPEYHDAYRDVVVNPSVIIEVLSPSTETFDRSTKFHRYQLYNPTLTDYLLVSQDKPMIEHYSRRSNGDWTFRVARGLNTQLVIESIGCTLKLADVYEHIKFDPELLALFAIEAP